MNHPLYRAIIVYTGHSSTTDELIRITAGQFGLKECSSGYTFMTNERCMEFVGESKEKCNEFISALKHHRIFYKRSSIGPISGPSEVPEEGNEVQEA